MVKHLLEAVYVVISLYLDISQIIIFGFNSSPSGLSQSSRASSNTSLNKIVSNGDESSTSSTVSCGSNLSLPSQESSNFSNNGVIKSVVNPQIQVISTFGYGQSYKFLIAS